MLKPINFKLGILRLDMEQCSALVTEQPDRPGLKFQFLSSSQRKIGSNTSLEIIAAKNRTGRTFRHHFCLAFPVLK